MGSFCLHERSKTGKDEWLTPPKLIQALGDFDLDPSSPVNRPWPTAAHHYTVLDDGLIRPWFGRVWCNPPYGNKAILFMRRLSAHGNGIALLSARTDTLMFFEYVWPVASAVFFFSRRIKFHHVSGEPSEHTNGAPSCLIAYGAPNVQAIAKSGLSGKLVELA